MIPEAFRRRIDAIVIGASAGGIEAISPLLAAFTVDSKIAVFVVLHIPRDRPTGLAQLFQRKCAMTVREAEDKEPVVTGTVYIAPPDYHLLIDKGPQLSLSHDDAVNFSRPSVDVLFESAADVYKSRLVAIILSGGNNDGTAGIIAVQNAGGLTIVQNPATASVSLMPLSAINGCMPDLIESPENIAALLAELRGAEVKSAEFGNNES